jgi:uncharacterized OB-fold protein
MSYDKPLPSLGDEVTAPYWESARRHELCLPECNACGLLFFYPRRFCPGCWADDLTWRRVAGTGHVWTFTEVHVPFYDDTWADDVPYLVAVIELDEGPHLLTNLSVPDVMSLRVGDRVEVFFDDVTDEVTLPKFRTLQ